MRGNQDVVRILFFFMSFYKIGVGISKLAVLGRMGSGGGFCCMGLSFDAKRRLGDDEEVRDHFC